MENARLEAVRTGSNTVKTLLAWLILMPINLFLILLLFTVMATDSFFDWMMQP
jgi:hypothetical protein